jgi:hypothetical protein
MPLNLRILAIAALFVAAMFFMGCPPPHANPFDPDAPNYIPPVGSAAPPEIPTRVRSLHTSRNITSQDTYVILTEVWTQGQDPIDSAWVAFGDQPRLALRPTIQQVWTASLTAEYFNDPQLGSVIGKPFHFTIVTARDCTYTRTPVYLFRVIEGTPVLHSPMNHDSTTAHPVLRWQSFTASFPFTYSATVIRLEQGYEAVIWTSDSLASTSLWVAVSDSLENGDYYWTLSAKDECANSSRSKEALFTVCVRSTE